MAFAELTLNSRLLHRPVCLSVLLPDTGEPKAVLTFLHGFTNRHDSALYYSSLPRYCQDLPLAVVFPDVQCSFYLDTAYGQPYWQHITQEIPEMLHMWLRLDVPAQRCFVAGISMGGYGAAKMALQNPSGYAHAFLFSPVTDLADIARNGFDQTLDPNAPPLADLHMDALLNGRPVPGSSDDLYQLLCDANSRDLPRFTIYTGTEDFLYKPICRFAQSLSEKGADVQLLTSPGIHCWKTWDPFLEKMAAAIAAQL